MCAAYAADQEWEPPVAKPLQQHPGSSGQTRAVLAPNGHPADVIELIMADHRRIRRLRQALDDAVRCGAASGSHWMLGHVWQRLAGLLQAHTRAEEEVCYLPMFRCGRGAAERRRDATADHDDIREAISEASLQPVGSAPWWRAVRAALGTCAQHLDREECGVLADGLTGLTMSQRRELGRQWSAFIAAWTLDAAAPQPGPAPLIPAARRPDDAGRWPAIY
jgi:hypothetical protein